jgi:DNA processing protein
MQSEGPKLSEVGQCLGVVGTRSASIAVCQHASEIARELADAGFAVVSGLALGVDGAAHRGALAAQSQTPTIAVLAHGLDSVYPASHQGLAREILRHGGVLISEYPPGAPPLKHQFLARNRIIAGLSRGVIVVQAGKRSGSLVTAQCAVDFGRDVFIVAGDEADERWSGGRDMLEQGAMPITTAADVLREYGFTSDHARNSK